MDLLSEMDVHCDFGETTLRIDPTDIKMSPLPAGKIKSLRASYYFMGCATWSLWQGSSGASLVVTILGHVRLTNILRALKP